MPADTHAQSKVGQRLWKEGIVSIIIIALVLIWVVIPLLYGFGMAFMPRQELYKVPPNLYPSRISFEHFQTIKDTGIMIGRLYWNTFITATVAVLATLYFSSLAGYAFSKMSFAGREPLFILVLLKLMIPQAALVIPWFYIIGTIGMIDNIFSISLPSLFGAWSIFFMRQYIKSVPDSYLDSARIDGAREITIFSRIVLPIVRPAIGALIIINYMYAWNWFLWPLIALQSNEKFTMNLGLNYIRWIEMGGGESPTDYGAVMAMTILYTVPFIIIYFSLQKMFVKSITLTGLKE